ncbi:MAG TPA: serine/threonine-protein kinase, partial [Kofleriaceae bacterium]|nr:serine/threonine-protein kinase [Kofleriaceae bacterium]
MRGSAPGGAARTATRSDLVGTVLGDRYQVIRLIGSGGMGAVYVARHLLIGRPVAIKVLHPEHAADEVCVQRFLNEGRAAGMLGHPNIVASTDMGFTAEGVPFLVLELLDGRTVAQTIDEEGMLPVARTLDVALHIASALRAAHAAGIIHRDLKSDNVFLVDGPNEGDEQVKVIDFGISKFVGAGRATTQKGLVMGTPDFMAPEQISAPSAIDGRVDVYALGAICYHMLAGAMPFAEVPFPLVLTEILTTAPPPVADHRPNLPPPVIALIERAMAKSPDDRFPDMAAMAAEIMAVAAGLGQRLHTPRGDSSRGRRERVTPVAMSAVASGEGFAPTLASTPSPAGTPAALVPPTSPGQAARRSRWPVILPLAALAVAAPVGWKLWSRPEPRSSAVAPVAA